MTQESEIKIGFRTSGRMLSVQGLYLMETNGEDFNTIITSLQKMIDNHFIEHIDHDHYDFELTKKIIRGVIDHQNKIDPLITKYLSEKWTIKRINRVLCAILRAAIFELNYNQDVPYQIILKEYMNMASAFGVGDNNNMVGGVLNKIIHNIPEH